MKKALFLLLVITGIGKLALCQKQGQDKIDSLVTVLESAKEDTGKVNTLIKLAAELRSNNPDTANYFAAEAKILAIKLNYKEGIADSYNSIGLVLMNLGKYPEALNDFNDALNIYNDLLTSETPVSRAKILRGKANSYNYIGIINRDKGDYPEGLKNLYAALSIYQEIEDQRGIASIYTGIGKIYYRMGNYGEALKNIFAALKIDEARGDKDDMAGTYNNIGILYEDQGNHADALKYYSASLKINEELGNKRGKAGNLNNIGDVYKEQGNYTEALKNYFEALKLNEELDNKQWKAFNLDNIGIVYFKLGNYNEALKYYIASLKLEQEIGDKDEMPAHFINIGNDYTKLKKYNEASRYLKDGLSLSKEIGSLEDISHGYEGLAILDSAQGQYKQSLENYRMYIIYRDSTVNEENLKKTVQIQMQYEFDKKESLAKAEQDKKDALTLKELQRQKLIRNGLISGFIGLILFAAIISIILIQRREIRLIKKERNRISRELHDDIGSELNRITMISHLLQTKSNRDSELLGKLTKISEAGKKVLGSIGEIIWTMNPQRDNLESLVAYIRRFVTEYLEMNGMEVIFEFPDEIPVKSVSEEYRRNIFLVVKEAIYNITKYSKADRVKLSMNLRKRMAEFEISDNGKGFVVEERQNWGNGLRNMDQRMKDIRGDFRITSEPNLGTSVRLTFPLP